ncbi:flavin reductase [Brucella endophytica]|uniref:Flavin reductase n=1 Tax=Brucella endophytica TaxID=1963359 RepID=A0A916S5E6_9HYPH|nr:flavin reductase family protein [Brucella endophytica]GGA85005.1 flavin reductase [Brucella endophytica]
MFYEPRNGHGLPHDPFKAIVAPRPIGWISTRSKAGAVNLAPYSFFNAICDKPPLVLFSSSGRKDSLNFIEETGEFAVNLVTEDLLEKMNASSVNAPRGVSEFDYAGLTPVPCELIGAPRVGEAHAALECVVTDIREATDRHGRPCGNWLVTGEVVGVHLDEAILTDGMIDMRKAKSVSRLGYMDFATTSEVYQMLRPRWEDR